MQHSVYVISDAALAKIMSSAGRMIVNDELERKVKELLSPNLKYDPGNFLDALRNTTQVLTESILFSDCDLNPTPPENGTGMLLGQ